MFAQQVVDSAPWWGVAAIAAGSALIGGFISVVGSGYLETRRRRYDRRLQREEFMQESCLRFLVVIGQLVGFQSTPTPRLREIVDPVIGEMRELLSRLSLTADAEVLKSGRELLRVARDLITDEPLPDDWRMKLNEQRNEFVNAVRHQAGLSAVTLT